MEKPMEEQKMEGTHPEKKIKAGAVSATIWKNQSAKDGKVNEYHTVSLQRSYKDASGAWQHANSLRVQDLPKATLVLDEAFKFLSLRDHTETPAQL